MVQMTVQNTQMIRQQDDSLWYKDAIIYQTHVRAFSDSNADGKGDFCGLTERLDYLQDLGVTALWLLPFYPSPLRDDGYDIADYTSIHPDYGTLDDFRVFLRESQRRGLRVITELVINHTSDQHVWFQRSRRAQPGSRWRDFYVWSDTPEKYKDARIIFKDFESSNWTWDPVANAYYWHRFFSHQPDLNYDNPEVHDAVLEAMDFWLEMGVDGLRLDAIPYLYEREGTICENLPQTHAFLKKLRTHVDQEFENRMLLAEANQWPEDAVAYFGEGDECHMSFHFPVMPRLFMAVRMEDNFPIVDILQQTPPIPENCQWATFLRNHDELTLEMVTDEERDYMYRTYARDPRARINLGIRRRLAPLLENDRRRIELLNGLLFSLPGSPVIYYGDEIGMGDNIYLGDRNGVRTPMQWSIDRNAGFSRANPQRLYLPPIVDPEYHYEAVNVELQQNNPHSLLWWMKRHIALCKRFQAFSRGSLEFLDTENSKILAFVRRCRNETILVVANLSRLPQYVLLDLSEFAGQVPVELSGRAEFPPIEAVPYHLTLGPHAFHWFSLELQQVEEPAPVVVPEERVPALTIIGPWKDIFRGQAKAALERVLPGYLGRQQWFDGRNRTVRSATITDAIPISETAYVTLVQVEYVEGLPETVVLPLTFAIGEQAYDVQRDLPQAIVARLQRQKKSEEGVLYDAMWDGSFPEALLEAIERERRFRGAAGQLLGSSTRALQEIQGQSEEVGEPSVLEAGQRSTSVVYGRQFILRLFRRLDAGVNPDLEIGRFLTERASFEKVPPVAGALEYRWNHDEPATLAVLHGFVPRQSDAWQYTLNVLGRYFEQVLTQPGEAGLEAPPLPKRTLLNLTRKDVPELANEMIGTYLEQAQILGERTAELHLALASDAEDPNFAPEPFSALYQRPLYQSIRNLIRRTFRLLRWRRNQIPETARENAREVLEREVEVLKHLHPLLDRRMTATRIRCHGNYHLEQVLYTGKDFAITDFEGEPMHSISYRRQKRSALKDVASMLYSFQSAAYTVLFDQETRGMVQAEGLAVLEKWTRFWYLWVGATFLRTYLQVASGASFLPQTRDDLRVLLHVYLMEEAAEDLNNGLNNRLDLVQIPLRSILQLMDTQT